MCGSTLMSGCSFFRPSKRGLLKVSKTNQLLVVGCGEKQVFFKI
jgi:hypothetical protein